MPNIKANQQFSNYTGETPWVDACLPPQGFAFLRGLPDRQAHGLFLFGFRSRKPFIHALTEMAFCTDNP